MKKKILGVVCLTTLLFTQKIAAQDSSSVNTSVSETKTSQISVAEPNQSSSDVTSSVSKTSAVSTEIPASSTTSTEQSTPPSRTSRALNKTIATQAMYRLYNANSGEHFYTANLFEAQQVINAGWNYEGIGWYAPVSGDPVYRVYNPQAGDHHYTLSSYEKDSLVKLGWRYEGIGWYSDTKKKVKLYRAYNPRAKSGSHNYTANFNEQRQLILVGWQDEGIAWYGSDIKPSDDKNQQPVQTYLPNQWYTVNGEKRHTDQKSNWMTGFQWISGKVYYFDQSGNMKKNTTVTDRGNTYRLNTDGILTSGDSRIEKAIASGMTKVGKSPYVLGGGRTPASIAANHFDCSSFVYWMYQQAGVSLGNQSSTTTWTQRNLGTAVAFSKMKRGDIFMMSNIGHVGLYLGGGYFIHSSPNAKYSTVYDGQAQPNLTHSSYDYNGVYYGGVGVSKLSDVLSKDPADGKHWVTYKTWEQIQDNVVRRLVK